MPASFAAFPDRDTRCCFQTGTSAPIPLFLTSDESPALPEPLPRYSQTDTLDSLPAALLPPKIASPLFHPRVPPPGTVPEEELPVYTQSPYINRDYEQSGYDDAMVNADSTYKDSKKNIIKNELRRLFEQVTLRYRNDLRDIEVQIEIVEQQGLINTASSLKARKDTYIEHMSVMKDMVESLEKEEPQMMSMVKSYERGFLKGLAAKSDLLLRNNHGNN